MFESKNLKSNERSRMTTCPECNEDHEQVEIIVFGNTIKSSDICDPCTLNLSEKARIEEIKAEKLRKAGKAKEIWESIVPLDLQQFDKSHKSFDKARLEKATAWIKSNDEKCLFFGIVGESGDGKSWTAAHMIKHLVIQGHNVLWIDGNGLRKAAQNEFNDDESKKLLRSCESAKWLVIDDVGVLKSTETCTEAVFTILKKRVENKLPMIWTSNEDECDMIPKAPEKTRKRILGRLFGYSEIIYTN